jgi:hypothetical protein
LPDTPTFRSLWKRLVEEVFTDGFRLCHRGSEPPPALRRWLREPCDEVAERALPGWRSDLDLAYRSLRSGVAGLMHAPPRWERYARELEAAYPHLLAAGRLRVGHAVLLRVAEDLRRSAPGVVAGRAGSAEL